MQGGDPTGTGRGGESIYGFVLLSLPLFANCLCIILRDLIFISTINLTYMCFKVF